MSFWPFGREPADVEVASRVITAVMANGIKVRGKLTIHFLEPQRQADADEAVDRCAAIAVELIRAATDHERVIGAEPQLCAQMLERYPDSIAPARNLEIAALHVVGDPALSDELRRASTGSMPAITVTPLSPPASSLASPPSSRSYPPISSVGSGPPTRRRSSAQMRAVQPLLLPPGTPPASIGAYVAPTVHDAAARLLIGFLRTHDLINVRRVVVDETSAEMLAHLVPATEAPPGGYEASRSAEIARWKLVLGERNIAAIRREVIAATLYLAWTAMLRIEVGKTLAIGVIEGLASSAFPEQEGLLDELGQQSEMLPPDFLYDLASKLTKLASGRDEPAAIATALAPLFAMIQEDMSYIAMVIKHSAG